MAQNTRQTPIQHLALYFLKEHYQQVAGSKNILLRPFIRTKRGHTADGLAVFKNRDNKVFTASVGANFTENLDMISNLTKGKLYVIRFLFGLLFIPLAAASMPYKATMQMWIAPVAMAILAFAVSHLVIMYILKRKLRNIYRQLQKYPANEKWVVLTLSSRGLSSNKLARMAFRFFKERGVGLLTIGERKIISKIHDPKCHTREEGDYLSFYRSEEAIRQELENSPSTPDLPSMKVA